MIDITKSFARQFALSLSFLLPLFLICCAKAGRENSNNNPAQSNAGDSTKSAPVSESARNQSPDHWEPSLVALSAGAYIVKRPSEWMDSESAFALLDENTRSHWATA